MIVREEYNCFKFPFFSVQAESFFASTPIKKGFRSNMSKQKQLSSDPTLLSLIVKAQGGDQSAFEDLLDRYAPLIDSMVHSVSADNFSVQDREDLRQEALIAFFRALTHYNTAQSEVQFGLYAKLCIKNALYSHLRRLKDQRNTLSLEDEHLSEIDNADPASRLMEEEGYLELSRVIHDALSEYENKIWWLYLSGRTAVEIANALDKDEKSVQNAIYRIRKKLRAVIPNS